ncbi:MAG: hypothetical protein CVT85_11780 [Alphaproteobacteria bacterium HGW-Alphaproteobacteria-7]|nr:MAG: hypothetical protein CVT85_11780 [Alphaproteobacteria bacterium HGW-Alphaproteobacteria-7]
MSEFPPKIIKLIDDATVVINRGLRDNIKIGDRFLVFGEGEEISDPDTGENLGVVEIVRGRVKVSHVQDKICTAKSIEVSTSAKKITRIQGDVWARAMGRQTEEIIEEPEKFEEPLDDPKIGDFVRPI